MSTTKNFGNMLNEKKSYGLEKPKKKSAWGELTRKETDIRGFKKPRYTFGKGEK